MVLKPLVMVVDDDRMVLHILKEQLAQEAIRVLPLSRVEAALDEMKRETFAVILADQFMPDISGLEFLQRCREIQPLSSRIVLTGMTALPGIKEALDQDIIHQYLLKPWSRLDLQLALHRGIERFRALQETATLRRENKRQQDDLAALISRLGSGASPAGTELKVQDSSSARAGSRTGIGEEMGTAIHEFNNQLAAILGYSELLLDRPELLFDTEKSQEYLRLIQTAARNAKGTIERVEELVSNSGGSGGLAHRSHEQSEGEGVSGFGGGR
jgi:response regulator RpfG family c-di-GMP phosphodiesterase